MSASKGFYGPSPLVNNMIENIDDYMKDMGKEYHLIINYGEITDDDLLFVIEYIVENVKNLKKVMKHLRCLSFCNLTFSQLEIIKEYIDKINICFSFDDCEFTQELKDQFMEITDTKHIEYVGPYNQVIFRYKNYHIEKDAYNRLKRPIKFF